MDHSKTTTTTILRRLIKYLIKWIRPYGIQIIIVVNHHHHHQSLPYCQSQKKQKKEAMLACKIYSLTLDLYFYFDQKYSSSSSSSLLGHNNNDDYYHHHYCIPLLYATLSSSLHFRHCLLLLLLQLYSYTNSTNGGSIGTNIPNKY